MSPESKPAVLNIQGVLRDAEAKMQKAMEVLLREFNTIRTGRASSVLVEGVRVDYYGTPTPLKQIANISTPDAKLITIQPWDANLLPEIEKALMKADLGLTPMNDGKLIRISVPPLSTERREELTKVAHKMAEEGRVSIRSIRHAAKEQVEKLFKDKVLSEDGKFKALDDLQKLTDRYHAKVDETLAAKEAELKIV